MCNHRFTTFERIEAQLPLVVKGSGAREAFSRDKLEGGVAAAAKGRPVTTAQIAELGGRIEDQLRLLAGGEVSSQEIGLAVLDLLRDLDDIAYLRFVSVYKGFEDAAEFERELGRLTRRRAQPARGLALPEEP